MCDAARKRGRSTAAAVCIAPRFEQDPKNEARTPAKLTDYLMANDPCIRKLGKRIAKQQDRLKAAITPKQFRIYLRIEEMVNERMVAIIQRAWAAAGRHGKHESD